MVLDHQQGQCGPLPVHVFIKVSLTTVRCHYNAIYFLQNPQERHPIANPFFCDLEILFMFYSCHCIVVYNIMICCTVLSWHSIVSMILLSPLQAFILTPTKLWKSLCSLPVTVMIQMRSSDVSFRSTCKVSLVSSTGPECLKYHGRTDVLPEMKQKMEVKITCVKRCNIPYQWLNAKET